MELVMENKIKKGYKMTEVGVIPEYWEVKQLRELVKLKNGYGFSSEFFSDKGPIVITPGNFKLDGGLIFRTKKTIRFSGNYSKEMQFVNGDLLIVMTDLTPDCNLLGKPGIVNSNEIILHNQRIGKISIVSNYLDKSYLYWFFASDIFSKRMKETATGSTVRHTSNGSIYNTLLSLPPLPEQKAIAQVLSDTDTLIESLEQLIGKKRLIKEGAMQELLRAKEGWELLSLGDVLSFSGGSQPPRDTFIFKPKKEYVRLLQIRDYKSDKYASYIPIHLANKFCSKNDIMIGRYGPPIFQILRGKEGAYNVALMKAIPNNKISKEFAWHYLKQEKLFTFVEKLSQRTSGQTGVDLGELRKYPISLPTMNEQIEIATILSDMDVEIKTLEEKLSKYQEVKRGLMQELLTGKIRLV